MPCELALLDVEGPGMESDPDPAASAYHKHVWPVHSSFGGDRCDRSGLGG